MFRLAQHETTVGREILAGATTFAAMAYILVVNPDMLALTGMDRDALVTATALSAAVGSILMALLTNYPVALAPGMGLNAFFAFTICGSLGVPWQGALAMVFWTGILFVVLSLTPFRREVVRAIPESLKTAIQAGIGLFILVVGLKNLGLFADPAPTFPALRPTSPGAWPFVSIALALAATGLVVGLNRRRVPGAILIAVLLATVAGLWLTEGGRAITSRPEAMVGIPASPAPVLLQLDWWYPFRNGNLVWLAVVTLLFVDLFDSVGTLVGVSRRAGLVDENGDLPRMKTALLADSGATAAGACLGVSPVTAYIESATGIAAGGRTGLTALVVAAFFLLALFFHPLLAAIPAAAVAPALLFVGASMLGSLRRLDWSDWRAVVPALATVVLIPLEFQIAEGIAIGCILHVALMTVTGRWKSVHWLLAALSILFTAKLVHDFASSG